MSGGKERRNLTSIPILRVSASLTALASGNRRRGSGSRFPAKCRHRIFQRDEQRHRARGGFEESVVFVKALGGRREGMDQEAAHADDRSSLLGPQNGIAQQQ